MRRYALIQGGTEEKVAKYLPDNYAVLGSFHGEVLIGGENYAGWTMDDYVLPRLASGGCYGVELDSGHPAVAHAEAEIQAELLTAVRCLAGMIRTAPGGETMLPFDLALVEGCRVLDRLQKHGVREAA